MLKGGDVKEIYEMKGAVCSIRGIADGLGIGPEHGAAIPEYAGGDAIEAAAVKRARQYLKTLGLKQAVEILDNTLR